MSRPAWYHSLYWRIAIGLIAFLALALAAQGLLFIWMTDRIAGSMPARSPRQLAFLVAADMSAALEQDPALDVEAHLRDQYGSVFQTIVVVMRDGRTATNRDVPLPPAFDVALRQEMARVRGGGRRGGPGRPPPDFGPPPDGPPDGPPPDAPPPGGRPRLGGFGPAPRRADLAPIVVNGAAVGLAGVPLARPSYAVLIRELGPTMGLVGGLVLLTGGLAIALVIFGPARRRLRHVQEATERLGAGDLSARAPDAGGDEVAQVARSFNRMAEDLAARAHMLDASDRARRQLLADVSHELMTPLTAMRGYIETLSMRDVPLDGPTRDRYIQIIDEETKRLETIVGDLLDLARLEGGGGGGLRRDRVSVGDLFERVAMRHEREIQSRRIHLERSIDPQAGVVFGDADRLEQALQNLAANALRHTPDGGRITLASASSGSGVRLVVRDSGPGIPPEHLPLIFDRFYKADASRRHGSGSGLGLSIVKTIVERHGGTIAARNDGGAVFEIYLPGATSH